MLKVNCLGGFHSIRLKFGCMSDGAFAQDHWERLPLSAFDIVTTSRNSFWFSQYFTVALNGD